MNFSSIIVAAGTPVGIYADFGEKPPETSTVTFLFSHRDIAYTITDVAVKNQVHLAHLTQFLPDQSPHDVQVVRGRVAACIARLFIQSGTPGGPMRMRPQRKKPDLVAAWITPADYDETTGEWKDTILFTSWLDEQYQYHASAAYSRVQAQEHLRSLPKTFLTPEAFAKIWKTVEASNLPPASDLAPEFLHGFPAYAIALSVDICNADATPPPGTKLQ